MRMETKDMEFDPNLTHCHLYVPPCGAKGRIHVTISGQHWYMSMTTTWTLPLTCARWCARTSTQDIYIKDLCSMCSSMHIYVCAWDAPVWQSIINIVIWVHTFQSCKWAHTERWIRHQNYIFIIYKFKILYHIKF